nr:type II toxin-antitoxin system RelE/ParE family toxin [Methylobacterium sp. GXS13]
MSRQARADLREIGDFIAADNPTRARSFVSELRTRCQCARSSADDGQARAGDCSHRTDPHIPILPDPPSHPRRPHFDRSRAARGSRPLHRAAL